MLNKFTRYEHEIVHDHQVGDEKVPIVLGHFVWRREEEVADVNDKESRFEGMHQNDPKR